MHLFFLLKRFLKISLYTVGSILTLLLLIAVLAVMPSVQQYVANKSAGYLAHKLGTKVEVKGFELNFLNRATLDGLYIEDKNGDTLLFAHHAEIKITDWFIFKDKPVVTYLGLENAFVNFYRPATDSVWNYKFVEDVFATKTEAPRDTSSEFTIDLRKIKLKNVRFATIDKWVGNDMEINSGDFSLDVRSIDYNKKAILIDNITGDKLIIGLRDYIGGRPARLKRKSSGVVKSTPFNPQKWIVSVNHLNVKDSRYFMDDPDKKAPPAGLFDEWKMDVRDINIKAENIHIVADTLKGQLLMLTAKERSGIEIKKMRAAVTVSPKLSECKNLYLETNNSIVKDYYAMHYDRFPDFEDYISKVRMSGHLRNSRIAINDIIYFAPEMKIFKNMIVNVNGNCGGTVDNLFAYHTTINDGISNLYIDKFSMNQLPDVDNSQILIKNSLLRTSDIALLKYFPALTQQNNINIYALKNIQALFDFEGTIHDFNINSSLNTALGQVSIHSNVQQIMSTVPLYSGNAQLTDFDLGSFTFQENKSTATGSFNFKGQNFDTKTLSVFADGNLKKLVWAGYPYQNIDFKGNFTPAYFDGNVNLQDPNADLNFQGKINYADSVPSYDFNAKIANANLMKLGFTADNIQMSGIVNGHFKDSTIDNFIGTASATKLNIYRDITKLNLNNIQLNATYEERQRVVTIDADNLKARVWGNYTLLNIPTSFQLLLSEYFPSYIKTPDHYLKDQFINFEIESENINDLLSIFNKNIKLSQGGNISGYVNTTTSTLKLNVDIPQLDYKDIQLDSLRLHGEGVAGQMEMNVRLNEISTGATALSKSLTLNTKMFRDSLIFDVVTTTPDEFGKAHLQGNAHAIDNKFFIQIFPSEIFVNNNKWEVHADKEMVIEAGKLNIAALSITSGDQQILVNGDARSIEDNVAQIEVKHLSIAPLTRYYKIDDVLLGGNIDGRIIVKSPLQHQNVAFTLVSANTNFYNDTLGTITLEGSFDADKSTLFLSEKTGIASEDAYATLSGKLAFDTHSTQSLEGRLIFHNARIGWLSPMLKDFVNNLEGSVNGDVKISGTAAAPLTQGSLSLKDVKVRPEINGETYAIKNSIITVNDDNVDVGTLWIEDSEGNQGHVTGTISYEKLNQFYFNLLMESNKISLLNLSEKEADNFYGNVFAKTRIRMSGPANDLNINISATPLPNSNLFIPIDYGSDLGKYNFIRFKKTDNNLLSYKKLKRNDKYNIRIDAVINRNLKSNIILDPTTGDQLLSSGTGNVILEIPSDGDIRLNGNYKIDEGTYNFAFRQLQILNYRKQFNIIPGSTIVWSGDLYNANLDVAAIAPIKARLYDLISNEIGRIKLSDAEIRDAQIAQIVNVKLMLQGTLQKPNLGFKIDLAENRSMGTYAYQKLNRINTDQKQLLNQVASLLLLDQFAPPDGFISNAATVSSGTINNMSEVFSSVASSQITSFANKIFKAQDLYVGVGYKNYNLSNSNDPTSLSMLNRNEAKLNVRKNFFNDRLLVDVGGVYDWGRPLVSSSERNANLSGDFRVQYLITPDGRIRFNIFRNSSYDAIFQQNIGRQGVGIAYRKSFNRLADFFRKPNVTTPDSSRQNPSPILSDTTLGQQQPKDSAQ